MSRELILVPKEKFQKMLEKIERGREDKLKSGEMSTEENQPSDKEELSDDHTWEEQSQTLEASQVEKLRSLETKPELPPAKKLSPKRSQGRKVKSSNRKRESVRTPRVEKLSSIDIEPELPPTEKISSEPAKSSKRKRESVETQWGVKRKLKDFIKPTKGRKWIRLR